MALSMVDAHGLPSSRMKRPSGDGKHPRLNSDLGEDAFTSAEEDQDGAAGFQEIRRKRLRERFRTAPSSFSSHNAGTTRPSSHSYVYLEAILDQRLQDFAVARKLHAAGVGFLAISSKGRSQILVKFATKTEATAFANNATLLQSLNCTAKVSDPLADSITGLIRGVDPDMSEEEMKTELSRATHYTLLKVTRIHKAMEYNGKVPTTTVLLQFKGTVLPSSVAMYFVSRKVELYVPKPTICYNCQLYGHIAKQCKSTSPICGFCAGPHNSKDCDKNRETETPTCANCQGNHFANSAQCPIMQQIHKLRFQNTLKTTYFQTPPKIGSTSEFPTMSEPTTAADPPETSSDSVQQPPYTLTRRSQTISTRKFSDALTNRYCTDQQKYEQRKNRYQSMLKKSARPQPPQPCHTSPPQSERQQTAQKKSAPDVAQPPHEFAIDLKTLITQFFTDQRALAFLLTLLKTIVISLPQGDQLETVNIAQLQEQLRAMCENNTLLTELNPLDQQTVDIDMQNGAQ